MKIKKFPIVVLSLLVLLAVGFTGLPKVYAAGANCGAPANINTDPKQGATVKPVPRDCDPALKQSDCSDFSNLQNCSIIHDYINPAIALVSALVGVVAVIAIIVGAIQFSSSAGDPQKAAAGKKHIINAVIALLVFFFLDALLNFLIPGGLF